MARDGLQKHVIADKVKWGLTLIAFVLVGVMLAGIICGWFEKEEGEAIPDFGEVQTKVLIFDDIGAKRTSYAPDKQVWEENGIVFTNQKGTGQDIGNYSAPVRLYARSSVTVASADMTKIVFYCAGTSYARALKDSFDDPGSVTSVNGSEVTVEFRQTVNAFEVLELTAQVQLDKLAVTAVSKGTAAGMVVDSSSAAGEAVSLSAPSAVALADLDPQEYDEYGISPAAESAYTLTATVNEDATVKIVDWTVQFADPASEWAEGKTVTDYVTVSSTGDLTATVNCLQAFGEEILVYAVSRSDPSQKAFCRCDYVERIIGAKLSLSPLPGSAGENIVVENAVAGKVWFTLAFRQTCYMDATPVFGPGTMSPVSGDGQSITGSMTLSLSAEAAAYMMARTGYKPPTELLSYEVSLVSYTMYQSNDLGDTALTTIFGERASWDGSSLFGAITTLHGYGFHEILQAKVRFETGVSHELIGEVTGYLDVDASSIYIPVTSVSLDEDNLQF